MEEILLIFYILILFFVFIFISKLKSEEKQRKHLDKKKFNVKGRSIVIERDNLNENIPLSPKRLTYDNIRDDIYYTRTTNENCIVKKLISPSPINYQKCHSNNPYSLLTTINKEYISNYEEKYQKNYEKTEKDNELEMLHIKNISSLKKTCLKENNSSTSQSYGFVNYSNNYPQNDYFNNESEENFQVKKETQKNVKINDKFEDNFSFNNADTRFFY